MRQTVVAAVAVVVAMAAPPAFAGDRHGHPPSQSECRECAPPYSDRPTNYRQGAWRSSGSADGYAYASGTQDVWIRQQAPNPYHGYPDDRGYGQAVYDGAGDAYGADYSWSQSGSFARPPISPPWGYPLSDTATRYVGWGSSAPCACAAYRVQPPHGRYERSSGQGYSGGYRTYDERTYDERAYYETRTQRDRHDARRRHGFRPAPIHVSPSPVYVDSAPIHVEAPRVHVAPPVVHRAPPVHVRARPIHIQPPPVYVDGPEIHVAAPEVHMRPATVVTAPPVHVTAPPVHVAAPPVYVDGPLIHVQPGEVIMAQPELDPPPAAPPRQLYRQEPGERG